MTTSIFDSIINRKIPSHIIYEDLICIAFLDINPSSPGHTLIVPKKQKDNLFLETPKIINHLLSVVVKLSLIFETKLNASGFKVISNIGESAGQEVKHTHIHLIPYYNDKFLKKYSIEEIYELLIVK